MTWAERIRRGAPVRGWRVWELDPDGYLVSPVYPGRWSGPVMHAVNWGHGGAGIYLVDSLAMVGFAARLGTGAWVSPKARVPGNDTVGGRRILLSDGCTMERWDGAESRYLCVSVPCVGVAVRRLRAPELRD